MPGPQLHTDGEEFGIKRIFREDLISTTQVDVGLFNDNDDQLEDGDTLEDINTEPDGSQYDRQSADLDTTDFIAEENADGNWQAIIDDLTFDTEDSSQDINAYFTVVDLGDGDQLFWSGELDQLYDLNSVDELVLQGAGLELD